MLKDKVFLVLIVHASLLYASKTKILIDREIYLQSQLRFRLRQKLAAITFKRRYIGTDGYSTHECAPLSPAFTNLTA